MGRVSRGWMSPHLKSEMWRPNAFIVAKDARGQGFARRMYEDLFAEAKAAGHVRVVCEVNIEPPNEGSLAFHRSMGFEALADVAVRGGSKRVRYLVRELG